MKLSEINSRYEEIIYSDISQDRKDRQLADLMTDLEATFKIPAMRNEEWEKENRPIIAMYRKISKSRSF